MLKAALIRTRDASFGLSRLSAATKRKFLLVLARELKKNKGKIFAANRADVKNAVRKNYGAAFLDRLAFDDKALSQVVQGLKDLADAPEHSGKVIEKKKLANGVLLEKRAVPIGVIGVIYEARPNLTVDVAALCVKAGSAVVLRGGSEAIRSNRALYKTIKASLRRCGLPPHAVMFVDKTSRKYVNELLAANSFIDLIIPRGGYSLVRAVVERSTVPVLYHASGGARIYVDKSADLDIAEAVCLNAKTSRPAVCNSLDTLVLHRDIAARFAARLEAALKGKGVALKGDAAARKFIKAAPATAADWETEYLGPTLAIKVVSTAGEAAEFINKYSKRHTEGIVANDKKVIRDFTAAVDAAALFVNCSTRLHDGYVFGLGAEMGIATGKLHARGPVGVRELLTYKWIATGKGQIRK